MLQNIRDNVQGIFAKIIMAIIIVPFALFGIDSLLTGGGVVNVAEVNGEEIPELELQQQMILQKRNLLSRLGEDADPALLDDALIREQVLQRIIQEKILLQKAEEQSMAVSARQIDNAIVNMPQFQQDNQFSPELYQNLLRNNGYTSPFFKQLLTKQLLIQQLNSAIGATNFFTANELADVAAIVREKRNFRYMLIPLTDESGPQATDEQVEAYYQKNQSLFQREEQVLLEYIELTKDQFYQPVDEQRLRDAFELELADFAAAEERGVSHIYVEITEARDRDKALTLADGLYQQLQQGADFAELARSNSDDIGSSAAGGELGYTSGDTFPEEFEEALFALTINQVSQPVETEDGFHLIKLTDIKTNEQPTFAERRASIEERIQSTEADASFVTALEDLKDYVFNSEDLAGPAESLGLKLSTTDWLAPSSEDGLFSSARVKSAVLADDVLVEGNNSEVVEVTPTRFVVARVKEYREAEPLPLAEVEGLIRDRLQRQMASEALQAKAEEYVSRLQSGVSLEELANQNNYEWQVQIDSVRNNPALQRELLTAAFTTNQLDRYKAVPMKDGGVAVLRVESVTPGNAENLTPTQRASLGQEIQRNYASWDFGLYLQSARESADIIVL